MLVIELFGKKKKLKKLSYLYLLCRIKPLP